MRPAARRNVSNQADSYRANAPALRIAKALCAFTRHLQPITHRSLPNSVRSGWAPHEQHYDQSG